MNAALKLGGLAAGGVAGFFVTRAVLDVAWPAPRLNEFGAEATTAYNHAVNRREHIAHYVTAGGALLGVVVVWAIVSKGS